MTGAGTQSMQEAATPGKWLRLSEETIECKAVSGPNHDGRSVFLALLAVPLLPVHPKAYWYGPILNSRNVAMALGPVWPAAFAQLFCSWCWCSLSA